MRKLRLAIATAFLLSTINWGAAHADFEFGSPELIHDLGTDSLIWPNGFDQSSGYYPTNSVVIGDYLYFGATSARARNSLHRMGTNEQVQEVLISGEPIPWPRDLTAMIPPGPNGAPKLAMSILDGNFRKLAILDPATMDLKIIEDTYLPGSYISSYSIDEGPILATDGTKLFFPNNDAETGQELWMYDSISETLDLVADMSGEVSSMPREIIYGGGYVFFGYRDSTSFRSYDYIGYLDVSDLEAGAQLGYQSEDLFSNDGNRIWFEALGGLIFGDGYKVAGQNHMKLLSIDPTNGPQVRTLTERNGSVAEPLEISGTSIYTSFGRPFASGDYLMVTWNEPKEFIWQYKINREDEVGDFIFVSEIEEDGTYRITQVQPFETSTGTAIFYRERISGEYFDRVVAGVDSDTPATAVNVTKVDGQTATLDEIYARYAFNGKLYLQAKTGGELKLLALAADFTGVTTVADIGPGTNGPGVWNIAGYFGDELLVRGHDGFYLLDENRMLNRIATTEEAGDYSIIGERAIFFFDDDNLSSPVRVYSDGQLSPRIPVAGGASIDELYYPEGTLAAISDTLYVADTPYGENATLYKLEWGVDTELTPVTLPSSWDDSMEISSTESLVENVLVVFGDEQFVHVITPDGAVEANRPTDFRPRLGVLELDGQIYLYGYFSDQSDYVLVSLGWDGESMDIQHVARTTSMPVEQFGQGALKTNPSLGAIYFSRYEGWEDMTHGLWKYDGGNEFVQVSSTASLALEGGFLSSRDVVDIGGRACFVATDYAGPFGSLDPVFSSSIEYNSGIYCEDNGLVTIFAESTEGLLPSQIIESPNGLYAVMSSPAGDTELYEINLSYSEPVVSRIPTSSSSPRVALPTSTVVPLGAKSITISISGATVYGFSLDETPLFFRRIDSTNYEVMLPEFIAASVVQKELEAELSTGRMVIQLNFETAEPAVATTGDPRAGTKRLDGNQAKVYAFDVVGNGKVTIEHNGQEIAWVRAVDETDPKLRSSDQGPYLVRTVDLAPGKNVVEVFVDGERIRRTAYTARG